MRLVLLAFAGALLQPPSGLPVQVDCLLARVNDQPITLADVKILDAFGLFDSEVGPAAGSRQRAILERFIDLKIVINLVRERGSVTRERVEAARNSALARLDPARLEQSLRDFGLTPYDLDVYLEQKLVFQDIISLRFGRSTIVTLREIEAYYQNTYVPDAKKRGEEPPPVLELLNEIEALLKAEKIARQKDSWIQNLKRQAEVQLLKDCLDSLDKE